MKTLRLLLILLIIFTPQFAKPGSTHGISVFGKLKYPENFTNFEYANPAAPKGGELKLAVIGSFDSLNPYILRGIGASELGLTYDTLLTKSDDEAFAEYGLVAEKVEVSDDRKSVIFTINNEAKFHDGTKITAPDIVFSFNILKEKGRPFYKAYYSDIIKVEDLGENRVKFSFSTGDNRELPLISGQLPVLSEKYYRHHDFSKPTLTPPLTSGPYKIEKIEPGKRIVYKRAENYWGKDLPVNKGRYNFDKIVIDYYRDETIAIEAFKAGEYDFRLENIAKLWATAYNMKEVNEGKIIKEIIDHEIPSGMQGFVFNTRRSKFSDAKVRKALNYAFDFEWTNKFLFFGAYTRTDSYFENSIYASSGLPAGRELELLEEFRGQIPEEVFTTEYHLPKTDGSGYARKNLMKAKQLLGEAGWEIEGGILVNQKTKEPMEVEFLLSSASFERVVAPMIKNLAKLGIAARMRTVDAAQYQKRLEDFDFDITVSVFAQSTFPGNEQVSYWHSSKVNIKGSRNLIGIKNKVVDALVEKIVTASDEENLIAATKALDRVLLWNFYVIPNWHIGKFRIIYRNKFGKPEMQPKYDLGLYNWWAK